jgi:transcriptional regulator with XRE-family HTH domain
MRRRELQAARHRLGLSQEALAKALGVTRSAVAKWEGGTLSVPTMVALAVEALERRAAGGSKQRRPA